MSSIMSEITNLPPSPPSPSSYSSSSPKKHSHSHSRKLSFHDNQPNSSLQTKSTLRKMPSSMRIFQEQHLNEFAHLHLTDNHLNPTEEEKQKMLLVEREKLEEARKIGRAKRQTMATHHFIQDNNKENLHDDSRVGWRPLSLLARRQPSTKPTQLIVTQNRQSHSSESQQYPQHHPQLSHNERERQRRYSNRTDIITPTEAETPDLSSPLPSDVNSPDIALVTPNQLGLALGCPSPPPIPTKSKARPDIHPTGDGDNSIQSSTYSWASSFSGETAELRTAAQYVPSISEEGVTSEENDKEEVLDSPEKVKRRRKRIVAIAHTVRQLEGVGSRDVEDPNFYHQLVKAWNDRPGNQPREPIWAPSNRLPPAPPPIPPRPEILDQTFDPYLAPPNWLAPPSLSPANIPYGNSPVPSSNLEHNTPNLELDFQPDYDSEQNHSNESYASSNPFRYSYASTLHDLALEQGLQHGNKLMNEKAWLKSPLFDQGTYFDANTPSAPLPVGQFNMAPRVPSSGLDESPSKSSENGPEAACVPSTSQHQPQRVLRRHDTNIGQRREQLQLGTPIALDNVSKAESSSAPTNWGLGFFGNWLKDELADESNDEHSHHHEEDFQYGEEGISNREHIAASSQNKMNTRDKISSFLAEGDMMNIITSNDHITHQALNDVEKKIDISINDISMESIPLTIDSNTNNTEMNLVIPPPLPTPEIEEISKQTGKSPLEINPLQPEECMIVAKEYQFLNPCLRQSYSIPSDILHHQVPHHVRQWSSTEQLEKNDQMIRREMEVQDGVGDLEVEVEVRALEHQRRNMKREEEEELEEEESWDLSEISSSQFRTPPLKIRPRFSHHDKTQSPSPSPTENRFPQQQLQQMNQNIYQLQLQELPPLPLSPPHLSKTPPRTPKSHLRPILPPLPPTPKYRRPTPPLLTNSNVIMKDKVILKNIKELEKVGVGYPQIQTPQEEKEKDQHQNYDHYCYPPSTELDIDTRMDNQEGVITDHPSYPSLSTVSNRHDHINQSSTSVVAGIEHTPRLATITDIEKALPPPQPTPKSRTPLILFILGFVMPILWFVGGWPILRPSPTELPTSEIVSPSDGQSRFKWLYHPDPMVKNCRLAAVISTPLIIIAGIIAVIVVVVVH